MIRSKVGLNVVVTGLGLGRLKALPFYNHLVCLVGKGRNSFKFSIHPTQCGYFSKNAFQKGS